MNSPKPTAAPDDRAALERFVYEDEDLERLEALLDEFNPFEAMQWTRQEVRHSSFLRWLLDPAETHGLQSYFLRTFLKRIARGINAASPAAPSVVDVDAWRFQDTQVLMEWEAIDILVRDDEDRFVAVVENKVDMTEHSRQLTRYRELIERQFEGYRQLFVYLTVTGEEPSDAAYMPVSYSDVATMIEITTSRKADQLNPSVRSFAQHYVEMLRRQIVEDSEIQELCRRIYSKHRRALDVLLEHRPDRQLEISEYLVSFIDGTPQLIRDHCTKSYVRFFLRRCDALPKVGEGWTPSKRLLLFELETTSGALNLKLLLGPGPSELREQIREVIRQHPNLFNKAEQRFYEKWWTCHSERWLTQPKLQNLDMAEIQSAIADRFARFLQSEVPQIEEALTGLESVSWRQS